MMNPQSSSTLRAPARLVTIAALATGLGVTPRALRFYEDRGLIRSHRVAQNARAYDPETVAIIETIVALRDVDLPIATIRDILALRRAPQVQAEALRAALLEIRTDKQRQIAGIDGMLEVLAVSTPIPAALQVDGAVLTRGRLTKRPPRFDSMMAGDAG